MMNPFRPTAGATPPELIGREGTLDEFEYGLQIGSGAPGLLTIITGARGIGKTALLSAAQDKAVQQGWIVVSETATPGFIGRIGETMRLHLEELGKGPAGRRITAVGVAGFTVTTQLPPERQVDWRRLGNQLLSLLAEKKTGLLFTVDEIHSADRTELSQLAADVQHFIRDGLPIGLVFAGLPAAVSDLLNEGVATFLRRAERIDLHAAIISDVERSYASTFREAGISISDDLIQHAAKATGGYPFLIQLIGYQLWRQAEINNMALKEKNVLQAIDAATRRHETTVIEAALSTASDKDKDFLRAMAEDDGPVTAGDIGKRLNARSNVVANYRARLIAAGLIEAPAYGKVDFTIPGLREYLRKTNPRERH
ncbi:ATP-binding protein [Paenarthrobacter sp. NPDC090520]|uniref:ATP-binding protein n=1 Tax=Paenarthrobacter sp. NPDC090520 TaxID=3364382 RepID=UPI0037F65F2F